jgi:hypothetical protein
VHLLIGFGFKRLGGKKGNRIEQKEGPNHGVKKGSFFPISIDISTFIDPYAHLFGQGRIEIQ